MDDRKGWEADVRCQARISWDGLIDALRQDDLCLRNGFGCQSLLKGTCCSLLFASSDESKFLTASRTRS